MSLKLVKATYDNRGFVVYGRDKIGVKRKFTIPFPKLQPYFYIEDSQGDLMSIDGRKVRKIGVNHPWDVPEERKKYDWTGEADIPFARRCLIDLNLKDSFEHKDGKIEAVKGTREYSPRVAYLDIEVYPHEANKMPDGTHEEDIINCITLMENTKNKRGFWSLMVGEGETFEEDGVRLFICEDERHLLGLFAEILSDLNPDVLTSWNVDFDVKYLETRYSRYGMRLDLSSINVFDLLSAYKGLFNKLSNKLADVVYEEGICEKRKERINYKECFESDREKLLQTNIEHTYWVKKIDEKHRIIDYYWQLRSFVGLESLSDTVYSSVLIDTLILRQYHNKYILPSKSKHKREAYEGAIVLEPKKGVHEGVALFDIKAYYPSVLISENLDPAIYFGIHPKDEKGLLPGLCQELLEERKKLKSEHPLKYQAVKGIVNSVYGVLASPSFRLFIPEIAARVTEVARKGLRAMEEKASAEGWDVICGDTDSLFLKVKKEEIDEAQKKLNVALQDRLRGDYELRFEKYYEKFLSTGVKKKYCGREEDGNLDIVGFEIVRGDSSKLTRKVQEEVLRKLLASENVRQYLSSVVQLFNEIPIEDIAIPKRLSKSLDDYGKGAPDFVKGSIYARRNFGENIKSGDRVYMLYIDKINGYPYAPIICSDDVNFLKTLDVKVNQSKMLSRCILDPLEDLLTLCGVSREEILGQGRLL